MKKKLLKEFKAAHIKLYFFKDPGEMKIQDTYTGLINLDDPMINSMDLKQKNGAIYAFAEYYQIDHIIDVLKKGGYTYKKDFIIEILDSNIVDESYINESYKSVYKLDNEIDNINEELSDYLQDSDVSEDDMYDYAADSIDTLLTDIKYDLIDGLVNRMMETWYTGDDSIEELKKNIQNRL